MAGEYIDLDGVRTWHDVAGDGPPVVLLHGGFSDSGEFDAGLAALDGFRVYRYDRRGHGRTPDVDGPLDPAVYARDLVVYLERVVGGPAALVGYSDGAAVALSMTLARPELARRLVLISAVTHVEGYLMPLPEPGTAFPDVIVDRYAALSPDGRDHFDVVAGKLLTGMRPAVGGAELGGVAVRTLVVAADDDIVAAEHTLALFRALSDAELAVVPGTSHALLEEKPDLCRRIVGDFLAHDPVPTVIPVRRAPDG